MCCYEFVVEVEFDVFDFLVGGCLYGGMCYYIVGVEIVWFWFDELYCKVLLILIELELICCYFGIFEVVDDVYCVWYWCFVEVEFGVVWRMMF